MRQWTAIRKGRDQKEKKSITTKSGSRKRRAHTQIGRNAHKERKGKSN